MRSSCPRVLAYPPRLKNHVPFAGDELLKNKQNAAYIEPFAAREEAVRAFLIAVRPGLRLVIKGLLTADPPLASTMETVRVPPLRPLIHFLPTMTKLSHCTADPFNDPGCCLAETSVAVSGRRTALPRGVLPATAAIATTATATASPTRRCWRMPARCPE